MSETVLRRERTWRRERVLGVALVLTAGASVGFLLGRGTDTTTETARCDSGTRVILCELEDGANVSIPLDVAWTGDDGEHLSGRPDCLRPSGPGLEDPVEVAWTTVRVEGREWRQVVWVGC